MTIISLTRAAPRARPGPRRPGARPGRVALARIGGGLAVLVPIVFLSTFITYCLGALSNSNPAATILGQDAATPAAVARLDNYLGLDRPLLVQYWNWLVQAVHGNLGRSYFTQIPVAQSIAQRLPVDLSIAILAVILAVAHRRDGRYGRRDPPGRLVRPRGHRGVLGGVDAPGLRGRDHPGGPVRGDGARVPGQRLRRARRRRRRTG